jgi:hypothetical protein
VYPVERIRSSVQDRVMVVMNARLCEQAQNRRGRLESGLSLGLAQSSANLLISGRALGAIGGAGSKELIESILSATRFSRLGARYLSG